MPWQVCFNYVQSAHIVSFFALKMFPSSWTIKRWVNTLFKCNSIWIWTHHRPFHVISDFDLIGEGLLNCPVHIIYLAYLTLATRYNSIPDWLYSRPIMALTSEWLIDSSCMRWDDRKVNCTSSRWGDRRLEKRITHMTRIKRIHELFCLPVLAVLLLRVLLFFRGRVCVVIIAIQIRCNVWFNWSLDWAVSTGWGIISIARILVFLDYAGALSFLSARKLIAAHITSGTRIVRLSS